ncbi:MAG: glutamine--fructose-6-phosphate transaminase (isomerizing) [Eubacteriales bacterium]|nr:glutamine--fructose-6-phosphate transaminase (isomerizing) [Eubacteriales bacterium]
MCGIIGYSGILDAKDVLLDGLTSLEYRGYDSCGICIFDENNKFHIIKNIGKVESLRPLVNKEFPPTLSSHSGMGHTRWATHGGVSSENAHPHKAGKVFLIHNGIIENYSELKSQYKLDNKLQSETDTEIVAYVLDYLYNKQNFDPLKSIRELTQLIVGTYSFLICFEDKPGSIYAVRKVSPLVCATSLSGSFLASDLTALIPYTKTFSVVDENTIIEINPTGIISYDLNTLQKTELKQETITWDIDSAKKGGFEHFMMKEIHEQPTAIDNTIRPRITNDGLINFFDDGIEDNSIFKNINKIQIVACGTALHAGTVGARLFQSKILIPIETYIASEYRYQNTLVDDKTLVIIISQSGETVDSLSSLKKAKAENAKTISIVNVKGSSIARESDCVLYTHAGPEIAVASTKAYTVQVALIYLLFCHIAFVRDRVDESFVKKFTKNLYDTIPILQNLLQNKNQIKQVAKYISKSNDAFYIGRSLDYVFSLEGALKLKEVSYIHTEAYAAGELKHGTIALIEDGTPVICVCTQKDVSKKFLSNVEEVKARNAFVILIITEGIEYNKSISDICITIPKINDDFSVFPVAVITQLIAYYVAYAKKLDIDKPRNLAKSVTVE